MAGQGKPKRPEKHKDVLGSVRKCVALGRFRDTRHATDRKSEREISLLEIKQVLETGFHEKSKDEFKAAFQAWNYAIRGRTIDRRELRIAVSFDEEATMLIITAIELNPI